MNRQSGPRPARSIKSLTPYVPGLSIEEIRAKYNLPQIIKLASNENPLGASPLVQETIKQYASAAFRYPQSGNPELAAAIAEKHNVKPENILIGNGSDEIIDLLIRIFASEKNSEILCFQPSFSIYPIQAAINGNKVITAPLKKSFAFDFDGLLARANHQTSIVFITTPDNPSGYCPGMHEVADFSERLFRLAPNAILVVDEAYMDFVEDEKSTSLLANGFLPDNIAFLRTFSKSYGMAGLRLGYGIISEKLANYFWRTRLPFSVNVLAERAGLAALNDEAFRKTTLKTVKEGRTFLATNLKRLGCRVWPSAANFIMFRLPAESLSAQECHERLLQKGIIIRQLTSYGLPENLRVSIGNKEENEIFLSALEQIISNQQKKPQNDNHP